jgi:aryl-alcohol dehydrogenase-like predicted oxidoreductase
VVNRVVELNGNVSDAICIKRRYYISLSAYGVLSRGLLSGTWNKNRSADTSDSRNSFPRFSGENLEKNLLLVEKLRKIADEKQTTVANLAIAWVLSRGEDIIPLVGARSRSQLKDTIDAMNLHLSTTDLANIAAVVPANAVAGERYNTYQMSMLNSEQ